MNPSEPRPRGLVFVENRVKHFFNNFPQARDTQAATAPHYITVGGSAVMAANNYCIVTGSIVRNIKQRRKSHKIVFYENVPETATQGVKDFLSELGVEHVYQLEIHDAFNRENQFSLFTVLLAVFKLIQINEMGKYDDETEVARASKNKIYRAMKTVYKKHGLDRIMLSALWSATVDKYGDYLTFPICDQEENDEEDEDEEEEHEKEVDFSRQTSESKINTSALWFKYQMIMVTTNLHPMETSICRNDLSQEQSDNLYQSVEQELEKYDDYTVCSLREALEAHFVGKLRSKMTGEAEEIVASSFYILWYKGRMHGGAALSSDFNGSILFLPKSDMWEPRVEAIANMINERSDQNEVVVRFERLEEPVKATTLASLSGEDYRDQYFIEYRFNKEEMESERMAQLEEVSDLDLDEPIVQQEVQRDQEQRGLKRKSPSPEGEVKKPKREIDSDGEQENFDEDKVKPEIKKEEVPDSSFDQHQEQDDSKTLEGVKTEIKTEIKEEII